MANYELYSNKKTDHIYLVNNVNDIGTFQFAFDKKKIYNLFIDYPSFTL